MNLAKRYNDFYRDNMKFSNGEMRATDNPFYSSEISEDIFDPQKNRKLTTDEKCILDVLPLGMKILYNFIDPSVEPILDNLFFFSLNEILDRYGTFPLFFDLGTIYAGMGHVIVLSYSEKEKKFFFREDGGANGWERIANYEKYKSFDPSKKHGEHICIFPIYRKIAIHQLYKFDEILELFKR